jgi:hypothetical protein
MIAFGTIVLQDESPQAPSVAFRPRIEANTARRFYAASPVA